MNNKIIFLLLALATSCYSKHPKLVGYEKLASEIDERVFMSFSKNLPAKFENNLKAVIRYSIGFNQTGCSGVSAVFQLNDLAYEEEKEKLISSGFFSIEPFQTTQSIDSSHGDFLSVSFGEKRIAYPKIKQDYCFEPLECIEWTDLMVIFLETNKQEVFSLKNIDPEYAPDAGAYNYSIGAMVSDEKKQIIYWLYIYE